MVFHEGLMCGIKIKFVTLRPIKRKVEELKEQQMKVR